MTDPSEPLSDEELQELDRLLLYEVDSDDSMVIDTFDGYLHAIAIGPRLTPKHDAKVWAWTPVAPRIEDQINPCKSDHLINRFLRFTLGPARVDPYWETVTHRGGRHRRRDVGPRLCHRESELGRRKPRSIPQKQGWYERLDMGQDDSS